MRQIRSDEAFNATRASLRTVATHIVARARSQGTGRFGLRVTPGGFGTPEFGPDLDRVRVAGGLLVRESAGVSGASSRATAIDGSSLSDLAVFANVDLTDAEFTVGADTPPLGDVDAPLRVDRTAAVELGEWYDTVARALDRVVVLLPDWSAPTAVQLWPEHFDVALDVAFDRSAPGEQRVNLGGSPGDESHDGPYLYVGPWTSVRPGDQSWWNAPFGAVCGYDELIAGSRPVDAAADFFAEGVARLTA